MSEEISHKGFVKEVSDKKIIVSIIAESACSSCHAKGTCTAADMKDKEIEITDFSETYHTGQMVNVTGKTSHGYKALFYGYLMPLILVIVTLALSLFTTKDEGLSGLLALSILFPYYLILFLFRNHFKRSFSFKIMPIS